MKKFKKNRWYISIPKGYALVCYQGKNRPSYGFNFSGKWTEEFNLNICKRKDFKEVDNVVEEIINKVKRL